MRHIFVIRRCHAKAKSLCRVMARRARVQAFAGTMFRNWIECQRPCSKADCRNADPPAPAGSVRRAAARAVRHREQHQSDRILGKRPKKCPRERNR